VRRRLDREAAAGALAAGAVVVVHDRDGLAWHGDGEGLSEERLVPNGGFTKHEYISSLCPCQSIESYCETCHACKTTLFCTFFGPS
jgi:hypothetical protein